MTRLAPTEVELEIPLAPDELAAAEQRAFQRVSKKVRLPGFRAGKVPRRLFEQTYGTDAIASEALDDIAPIAFKRALREHELDPIDRPTFEILPSEQGEPIRIKARVEVRPTFDLGQYKGVKVTVPAMVVTDDQVERTLAQVARDRATLVPVEREARLGDAVTIDYEGRIDGTPFEGGSAQRREVELSEERFIPGFAGGIVGMRPGESKSFEAAFPSEYPQAEYAGKSAEFRVTLHEVKEVDVPPIDDELAKNASQVETIEELRRDVRVRLEAVAKGRRRRAAGNAVMEHLLNVLDVPVPRGLLEREIESIAASQARGGENQDAEAAESTEAQAAKRVKAGLVLEAVAKAERIEATQAEIKEEIAALARSYGQPPERMRKAIGSNLRPLTEGIVRAKAMDLLIESAVVEPAEALTAL
ncbi:MAG: trigger factor [Candidatus Tyrphobacter sp.]